MRATAENSGNRLHTSDDKRSRFLREEAAFMCQYKPYWRFIVTFAPESSLWKEGRDPLVRCDGVVNKRDDFTGLA